MRPGGSDPARFFVLGVLPLPTYPFGSSSFERSREEGWVDHAPHGPPKPRRELPSSGTAFSIPALDFARSLLEPNGWEWGSTGNPTGGHGKTRSS